jgi:hypothetical protein
VGSAVGLGVVLPEQLPPNLASLSPDCDMKSRCRQYPLR